jgi:hypothetical protein
MYIPRALFAFHAHTNKRWGTSPFYLTYGIKPILPHQTSTPISRVERAEAAEQRRKALQTLQTHRTDAAKRYRAALKQLADQRDDTSFAGPIIEGDLVMRKVQSRKTKLHPKWDGPFVVYEVTDSDTYQLMTSGGYVLNNLTNGMHLRKLDLAEGKHYRERFWQTS